MSLNVIDYYLREAYQSILRNSWLALASIGVVAVSLLIFGGTLLMVLNANNLARGLESGVEISLFLKDNTPPGEVSDMEKSIRNLPEVASVEFIPKEQALDDMKKNLGDNKDILSGLEEKNPLPDAFRIKARDVEQVPALAGQFMELRQADQVRYGQGVVEKILAFSRWLRIAGMITMVLLGAAAVFLIATTIRLSVFSRRREIEIMKFLGATNWFVRLPFLLEGMALGLFGSLLAVAVIYVGYISLVGNIQFSLPFMQLVTDRREILPVLEGLTLLGIAIGAAGSMISVRKFLKV
ncbi:MAG: permease-like cell division protein FtsX [Eubacteriales bacterium]